MGGIHVFTLVGVPVHVSMWFFLLLGYYTWSSGLERGLLFGVSVCVSILIHEFGHALVAKAFRLSPSIELHGFGGLTYHQRAETNRDDILIIAAGPGAGLVFGGIVYLIYLGVSGAAPQLLNDQPYLELIFDDLLFINIAWSLVNLLPLWPLDGGQLFRILMLRFLRPVMAERVTHGVGIAIGVVSIGLSLVFFGRGLVFFIAIMLTIQNARRLNDSRASGPIRLFNRFARTLLKQANEAYDRRDWQEAAQLCHRIRAEKNIDTKTLDRTWTILSVASVELGSYEEAWSYIQRAKLDDAVFFAKSKAVVALDKRDEAKALVEHRSFGTLPLALKENVQELATTEG